MADARHRADIYAEAAGLALGEILAIVEAGAEQDGHAMRGSYAATLSKSMPAFRMPMHTEGLELVAGVQVTYALIPR